MQLSPLVESDWKNYIEKKLQEPNGYEAIIGKLREVIEARIKEIKSEQKKKKKLWKDLESCMEAIKDFKRRLPAILEDRKLDKENTEV